MHQNGEENKSTMPAESRNYDESDDSADDARVQSSAVSKRNGVSRAKKKRLGRDYVRNAFTVNTSYCRSEVETIQLII